MTTHPDVYAVPGQPSIIDVINPDTGRTRFLGHTEAEVLARYPAAVRMTFELWKATASAAQQTPITWSLTTASRYQEMLEVLPPAAWFGGAFLVGEPVDHDIATGRPRFDAYWLRHGCHFTANRPLTVAELRNELSRDYASARKDEPCS